MIPHSDHNMHMNNPEGLAATILKDLLPGKEIIVPDKEIIDEESWSHSEDEDVEKIVKKFLKADKLSS